MASYAVLLFYWFCPPFGSCLVLKKDIPSLLFTPHSRKPLIFVASCTIVTCLPFSLPSSQTPHLAATSSTESYLFDRSGKFWWISCFRLRWLCIYHTCALFLDFSFLLHFLLFGWWVWTWSAGIRNSWGWCACQIWGSSYTYTDEPFSSFCCECFFCLILFFAEKIMLFYSMIKMEKGSDPEDGMILWIDVAYSWIK